MGWFKKFFKKWVAPIVGIAVGIFAFPVVGLMGAVAAGAAAAAVTQVGISMVTSAFDVPDYSANTADGASAKNSGVLVNKVGTNNAIPVVYGRRKIGGSRVYVSTNGTNNEDLFVVMVFCEGTINAVKKLFIDNNLVADASDLVITGNTPGPITNSDYSAGSRLTMLSNM